MSCLALGGLGATEMKFEKKNQLYDPSYVKNRCTDNLATPCRNQANYKKYDQEDAEIAMIFM